MSGDGLAVAVLVFCCSVEPMNCGDDRVARSRDGLHSFLLSQDEPYVGEKSSAKQLRYGNDDGVVPERYGNDVEFKS